MSSQSITNKLIANIKQTSSSNITTINNQNLICIDTSHNRIGINTITPNYSLTISGNTIYHGIKAPYLYITTSGEIAELSTNYLFVNEISTNDISLTNGDFSFLDGNELNVIKIDCSDIDTSFINIKSNFFYVDTISCIDLSVTNLLSVPNIGCDNGVFDTLTALTTLHYPRLINIRNITVDETSNLNNTFSINISAITISCDYLYVKQRIDASYISVSNDMSINGNIFVDGSGIFDEISSNAIFATNISADYLTINGSTIENEINSRIRNTLRQGEDASFENLDVSGIINMNFNNATISGGKFEPNKLIIPNNTTIIPNMINENFFIIDNSFNLYIKNKKIKLLEDIVYLEKKDDLRGQRIQDIIYDITPSERYIILNYNHVKINNTSNLITIMNNNNNTINYSNYNFKFIGLNRTNYISHNNIFNVNTISYDYLEISGSLIDNIINPINTINFELYANVSLKFYNKIPNDVEINNYVFGVYDYDNNNVYTYINNTIMVFDNSFNYANSNINYFGSSNNINPKIKFFIGSLFDNSFIYIDSFHCTIKVL